MATGRSLSPFRLTVPPGPVSVIVARLPSHPARTGRTKAKLELRSPSATSGMVKANEKSSTPESDCSVSRYSPAESGTAGVASDEAATFVVSACRSRFPQESTGGSLRFDVRPLSYLESISVTGRAGLGTIGTTYSGTLYNGLDSVTVTQVRLSVTAVNGADTVRREYRDVITIPPLSAAPFSFDILTAGAGFTYSWGIVSVQGRDFPNLGR